MTKWSIILLICFSLGSAGQNFRIDTLRIPSSTRFKGLARPLFFPIINTENHRIDSMLNFNMKDRFTNHQHRGVPIDSSIIKYTDDALILLNFRINYKKDGILSLQINAEGCGAYCSIWTDYFNYSIVTGKPISISSIVDTTADFRVLVLSQANAQYDSAEKELKKMFLNNEIDSSTYEWGLEQYTNGRKSIDLENFALYPDRLEIIETCYMPNAIKNLTPTIELEYYYEDIKKYMKLKNIPY